MRKAVLLAMVSLMAHGLAKAQPDGSLERVPIVTLDGYYSVRDGEFQARTIMEPNMGFDVNGVPYWLLYVAKNESSGLSTVYQNGQPRWLQRYGFRPVCSALK